MGSENEDRAALLRRFEEIVSGPDLLGLKELTTQLDGSDQSRPGPVRPELRHRPLAELFSFRIRVDIDGTEPAVWRRLAVRSRMSLEGLHQVIQVVFGWDEAYPHWFSLGGDPSDSGAQVFAGEPELAPTAGFAERDERYPAAAQVRLDEAMNLPGQTLRYAYGFDDGWRLTIRLEEMLPGDENLEPALLLEGVGEAPPEGYMDTVAGDGLDEDPADAAPLDVRPINRELQGPCGHQNRVDLHPRLWELIPTLAHVREQDSDDLTFRLCQVPETPDYGDLLPALRAVTWFLDQAEDHGIELTAAGYLKPAAVEQASQVVPRMWDWIGSNSREAGALPLLHFRKALQDVGLLRQHGRRLILTGAGRRGQEDLLWLWRYLAGSLVPAEPGFAQDTTLLLIAQLGLEPDALDPLAATLAPLSLLGWCHPGGVKITTFDIRDITAWHLLSNITTPVGSVLRSDNDTVAAMLARAAVWIEPDR